VAQAPSPVQTMGITTKYEYRRNLPHIQRDGAPHSLRFSTFNHWGLPPQARDLVYQHCLQENEKRILLHAFVVMPDHVHLLCSFLRDKKGDQFTLSRILHSLKGASAHSINKLLERKGSVWQDESFDHIVRSYEKLESTVEYFRQNPVRRGLAKAPEQYRWLWVAPKVL
jgi:REP element-mobilizing transposase RayT